MTANLITIQNPRSPAADAFRTLRTNLLFSNVDRTLQLVGATAPAEDDGKGRAVANLAVTMAQSGRRTVLVDADLRVSSQHKIWGANNEQGLTTMMLEDSALDTPPLVSTEVENLRILPAGPPPPNPVDILASARMDMVVQRLVQDADFLLFDMPPILVGADALVLGQKLDGMVLMVQANKTRRDQTTKARLQLERVGVNLLGAVLLDAPLDRTAKSYR